MDGDPDGRRRELIDATATPGARQVTGARNVMLAFHMFATRTARPYASRAILNRYLRCWSTRRRRDVGRRLRTTPATTRSSRGSRSRISRSWSRARRRVGTPAQIVEQVREYDARLGGFEHASLQVNFNTIACADAGHRWLFSKAVMPYASRPRMGA
jgi:hypothetical protein